MWRRGCLVPWAPVLPSASVRPPAPQRGARSLRTTTIWSALILWQIRNYCVVLKNLKSEKVQKKVKTPEWLGVLVGGRAKLSTGWMGVGVGWLGWGAG